MSNRRTLLGAVGAITVVLLVIVINPWFTLEPGTLKDVLTWAFWISFIILLILLFQERNEPGGDTVEIEGPAFVRFLFNNSRPGLFWLPVRLFIGFAWLSAGWHKLQSPAWTGDQAGTAILGYWQNAVAVADDGSSSITYEWYRSFLQFLIDIGAQSWMTYLIPIGETAVGLGLIVGLLTGFAAFFGALLNMTFLLAGSASTNPIMFTLAVGVMLAWRVAGYYGLDRYVLPLLGTPWRPGTIATRDQPPPTPTVGTAPPAT